jgi:hypothetical protein
MAGAGVCNPNLLLSFLILTVHLEFILKSSADAMAGNGNNSATYLHFVRALYTRYRYMQHHYTLVSRKAN